MLLAYTMVNAQEAPLGEVTYRYDMVSTPQGINGVTYKFTIIDKPEQARIPGEKNAPYYEYYWEFGDGFYTITTDATVTHTYTSPGPKDVVLKTTGVYDDGDPPTAKMANEQPLNVNLSAPFSPPLNPAYETDKFEIDLNRTSPNVLPEEENIIILKYKNDGGNNKSGRIHLFYNEKGRGERGDYVEQFNLMGNPRIYNESNDIVSEQYRSNGLTDDNKNNLTVGLGRKAITEMQRNLNAYKHHATFEFSNLEQGEQSNIFVSLQTAPEIGDIEGKNVKVKAMLVFGNELVDTTSIDLTVAKAHDPNKISVSEVRESFRRIENRFLTYKVQFQNDGEAPAEDVIINVEIPEGLEIEKVEFLPREFKMKHLKNKDIKEFSGDKNATSYDVEAKKDSVTFTFRKVYLPGLKQEDIDKYKETTGSFKYKIKYRKKLKKRPLQSRAHIVFRDFDDREAVITGYTTTRFKPGLSLGPKAGVSLSLGDSLAPTYFVGVVASPYKSDKFYLQVEGLVGYGQFSCDYEPGLTPPSDCKLIDSQVDSMGLAEIPVYDLDTLIRTETSEYYVEGRNLALHIPVQVRRDLNKFISIGAGAELGIEFRRSTFLQNIQVDSIRHFWDAGWIPSGDPLGSSSSGEEVERNGTYFTSAIFADVLIGSVKAGPAVGVRYLRGVITPKIQGDFGEITPGKDRLQIFAQWKF